jgi:hypothetical protein
MFLLLFRGVAEKGQAARDNFSIVLDQPGISVFVAFAERRFD